MSLKLLRKFLTKQILTFNNTHKSFLLDAHVLEAYVWDEIGIPGLGWRETIGLLATRPFDKSSLMLMLGINLHFL